MQSEVAATIRRHTMIRAGCRVAVACSGGPDSTALLFVLNDLAATHGFALAVCHFNHRLRGAESDGDEAFVRGLAERLGLAFFRDSADVRTETGKSGNLEAKARQLRYRFFRSLIEEGKVDRVAVGHTADDQAETVVHRILRGTGTKGFGGIHPVVEGEFVRPLIEVRREQVIGWLKERGEAWREDSSNFDVGFTRNRIRRELMPKLSGYNPHLVETLAGMAEVARDEEAFWDRYISKLAPEIASVQPNAVELDIAKLQAVEPAVARRLLRWAIQSVILPHAQPFPDSLGVAQTNRLLRFAFEGQSGTRLELPGGLQAAKDFSRLAILMDPRKGAKSVEGKRPSSDKGSAEYRYSVVVPGEIEVFEAGRRFKFQIVPAAAVAGYNNNESVLIRFNLGLSLTLRSWRSGDCLRPKGHRTPEKLKEFFQRKRISIGERGLWPVVAAGNRIVWTRGLGVDEEFLPTDRCTQAILLSETAL